MNTNKDKIDYSYWSMYSKCKKKCKDNMEEFNIQMAKMRETYLELLTPKTNKEVDKRGTRYTPIP